MNSATEAVPMLKGSNYIDGQWKIPETTYFTTNPARPASITGEYAASNEEDVIQAVSAASRALPLWRSTPGPERSRLVDAVAAGITDRRDDLARTITAEMGKPLNEAYAEVDRSILELRFTAGEGLRAGGSSLPSSRPQMQIHCSPEPLGVIASITPWNFPLTAPIRKIGPAMVHGCTTVLKPAEQTPGAATILLEIIDRVGVPAGVVNMVTGQGRTLGPPLTQEPRVAGISFTGSTQVGLKIAATAAARNVRVQLEMGGKNAALVAKCSDIPRAAVHIVAAAFQGAGQRCTSISRVITLRENLAEIEEAIYSRAAELVVGDGLTAGTTVGPLTTADQKAKCIQYVEQARADGGLVLTGGEPLDGQFFQPTVISDVPAGSPAAMDEIFGPVLVIIAVDTIEEMITVHNEVAYGLTASVFCDDMDMTARLVASCRTGMVHVNHGTASEAHVPFGGIKNSGMGGYSIGATNQQFFTTDKVVYQQYR